MIIDNSKAGSKKKNLGSTENNVITNKLYKRLQ